MAYKHITLWKCLFSLVITVNVKQEIVIIFLIKLEAKKVMPTISDINSLNYLQNNLPMWKYMPKP